MKSASSGCDGAAATEGMPVEYRRMIETAWKLSDSARRMLDVAKNGQKRRTRTACI